MTKLALLLLGTTVLLYWGCVGYMVLRVSRKGARMSRVLVPTQTLERFMWLVWLPLIAAWMALPWIAWSQLVGRSSWLSEPAWSVVGLAAFVRAIAACAAAACLGLSIRCWSHMGRQWRMGVDPAQRAPLLRSGPFALSRHPIYALSIALMAASAVVLPTWPMLVIATIHVLLMNLKAWNEERFLLERYGDEYRGYQREVARFLPFAAG